MPYSSSSDWDRPVLKKHRDPFFTRIWLLVAGLALLMPLVIILRPTGEDQRRVETSGLPGAVAVIQPAAGLSSTAPSPADSSSSTVASTVPAFSAVPAAGVAESVASTVAPTASVDPARVAVAPASTTTLPPTTPAPTTTIAPATTQAPVTTVGCPQRYEVEGGDSWSGIAASFGIGLRTVLDLNSATIQTALYPGDQICLPAGAERVATTTTAPKPTSTAPKPTTTAPKATTTSPPQTTANPETTAPRSYSHDEIEQIIRDVFPDELEEYALKVAWRESTYRPGVRNSCCYGLFQIHWNAHKSWLDDLGITSAEQLYEPRLNAEVALAVYLRAGGWGPWGG